MTMHTEICEQPALLRSVLERNAAPIAEVAAAAVFFASDETANITGQGLVLDGGAEINSHFHMA